MSEKLMIGTDTSPDIPQQAAAFKRKPLGGGKVQRRSI